MPRPMEDGWRGVTRTESAVHEYNINSHVDMWVYNEKLTVFVFCTPRNCEEIVGKRDEQQSAMTHDYSVGAS